MNILITGGVRSGKSHFAQEVALKLGGPVLFVATAEAGDEEMRQRIEAHQQARPDDWHTLEVTTRVGGRICREIGRARVVIVDCVTLWVSNILGHCGHQSAESINASAVEKEVMAEISELEACMGQVNASFIIVTNEVGLGLVPADRLSRLYRDLLGKANQLLAQSVDEVYLMVTGLPLTIKPAEKRQ